MTEYLYTRDPAPGDDELSEYLNRQFKKISDHTRASIEELTAITQQLIPAGYGGMKQDTGVTPFDLGAGWITLPFDTQDPTAARGVTIDLVNDTFTPLVAGVWRISVGFNIANHDSSNQGRKTTLRLINTVTLATTTPLVIGIGRNVTDTDRNLSILADIVTTGDPFRIELGGGSAVVGGELIIASFGMNFVGELGSLGVI